MSKYNRMVLDLTPEVTREIEKLKDSLKVKSRTELIRYALGLLVCVVQHKREGYQIHLVKGNEVSKVIIPVIG